MKGTEAEKRPKKDVEITKPIANVKHLRKVTDNIKTNPAKEAVANDTFASPEHQVQYNKGDMYCYKIKSSKEAVDAKNFGRGNWQNDGNFRNSFACGTYYISTTDKSLRKTIINIKEEKVVVVNYTKAGELSSEE